MIYMVQSDIYGNIIPHKLCKCGCGKPVNGNSMYVWGHNARDFSSESRSKISIAMIERWNDPENKANTIKAMVKRWSDPKEREKISDIVTNQWKDPEFRMLMLEMRNSAEHRKMRSAAATDRWDNPEFREKMMAIFNEQEYRERSSAAHQGQDYDAGEWNGFTNKARPHILPTNQCIQLNDWFMGSEGHHITKSVVVFIPVELHKHISHNLMTGSNMGEMNALAIQFINGGL